MGKAIKIFRSLVKLKHLKQIYSHYFVLVSDACYKSKARFYWGLALLLSLVILISNIFEISVSGAEQSTLDKMLKIRWSSPEPSHQIVILDIDEKTLAKLAPSLGRWPWKREVLAEVLSEIESAGASSIIFNVLITDPDKGNEQSDAILDQVAQSSKIVVYPMVRLPKINDGKSALHIGDLSGTKLLGTSNPTVAVILSGMQGMQKSMGISNLDGDDDGVLRQYNLNRIEESWAMPTLVGRAISLANIMPEVVSTTPYTLNWRNKHGSYQRISFVDYYASLSDSNVDVDKWSNVFKGKHIVIGASAPGISNPKSTAVNTLTDDNEIIATALDDAINGTNLKPAPRWAMAVLAIIFVFFLAYMFSSGNLADELNIFFTVIEFSSVAIMFLAISYTNYFMDMTPLATYGMAFFMVAKVHQNLTERIVKGSPEHFGSLAKTIDAPSLIGVLAFYEAGSHRKFLNKTHVQLAKIFGLKRVFLCFDVFGENMILSSLEDIGCIVIVKDGNNSDEFKEQLVNYSGLEGIVNSKFDIYEFPISYRDESQLISKYIGNKMLLSISNLSL